MGPGIFKGFIILFVITLFFAPNGPGLGTTEGTLIIQFDALKPGSFRKQTTITIPSRILITYPRKYEEI